MTWIQFFDDFRPKVVLGSNHYEHYFVLRAFIKGCPHPYLPKNQKNALSAQFLARQCLNQGLYYKRLKVFIIKVASDLQYLQRYAGKMAKTQKKLLIQFYRLQKVSEQPKPLKTEEIAPKLLTSLCVEFFFYF